MNTLELVESTSEPSPTKVILGAVDGLAGLPLPKTGKTELETANTPHCDQLVFEGNCSLMDPIKAGIIFGSLYGYLAIFGFNPLSYTTGRGAMEGIGINFDLREEDIAARGNFANVDKDDISIDSRIPLVMAYAQSWETMVRKGVVNYARLSSP